MRLSVSLFACLPPPLSISHSLSPPLCAAHVLRPRRKSEKIWREKIAMNSHIAHCAGSTLLQPAQSTGYIASSSCCCCWVYCKSSKFLSDLTDGKSNWCDWCSVYSVQLWRFIWAFGLARALRIDLMWAVVWEKLCWRAFYWQID